MGMVLKINSTGNQLKRLRKNLVDKKERHKFI
jgi:hypothetical protein